MRHINQIRQIQITLVSLLFGFYVIGFIALHVLYPQKDSELFNYYTDTYGIIAGVGGLFGIYIAGAWDGLKSKVGRAVAAFSTGLGLQFLGQLSYGYYRYVSGIEVPYPSFGDYFYFLSIPLYIYGSWLVADFTGAKIKYRDIKYKLLSLGVVLLFLLIAYVLILWSHDFSELDPSIFILEVGYPIGQALFISFAFISLILSKNILGGAMKPAVLLMLWALIAQYIADLYFTYEVLRESLYAGGISDLLYVITYTIMAFALYKFGEVPQKVRSGRLKK